MLCQSYTTSEKRSGYKIVRIEEGEQLRSNPRILFTETTGHEDMIRFMSSYQCLDRKTKKHYHPRGMLCWYGCNRYGEMNGFVQPIKRVPEFVWIYDFKNKGYQQLKRERNVQIRLADVIARDPKGYPYEQTNVKKRLVQETKRTEKRRKENASSKENRNE